MMKKILSVVLALFMVVALWPVTALAGQEDVPEFMGEPAKDSDGEFVQVFEADEDTELMAEPDLLDVVYLDGQDGDDTKDGKTSDTAVKTVEKAAELVKEGGTIMVCGMVEWKDAGEVKLEGLNFKRAPGYENEVFKELFKVSGSSAVSLTNVKVDGNKDNVKFLPDKYSNASLFNVSNGGTLNIGAGTEIFNNDMTAVRTEVGKNFENEICTVNMTGGEIRDNDGKGAYAGGVFVNYNGVFIMSGGKIYNNTAEEGAGVRVQGVAVFEPNGANIICKAGEFTMTGGVIEENTAWNDLNEGVGGGISSYGNTKLINGEIKNNSADFGAGVAVLGLGTTTLEGASITGNTCNGNGAGVFVEGYVAVSDAGTGATFELKSGSITGNVTANGNGGGIYGYFLEKPTIIRITGGTVAKNEATYWDAGNAIAIAGESDYARLELSDSPTIIGDIFLRDDLIDDISIDIVGAFTPAAPIEITASDPAHNDSLITYASSVTPNTTAFIPPAGFWLDDSGKIKEMTKVTFSDGIEVGNNVVVSFKPGLPIDPAKIPTFSRGGYRLTGWEKDGVPWDLAAGVVGDTSFTLTAVWSYIPPAHSHQYGPEWSSDASGHWHECACGSRADAAEHTFGAWALQIEAGNQVRTCDICGYRETEALPVPGATELRVTGRTTSSVTLEWDKVEGAQGYTVWYRSENETTLSRKIVWNSDATTWTHKDLQPGIKYFYAMKAWTKMDDSYLFGPQSSVQRGTTKPMAAEIKAVSVKDGKIKVILKGKAKGAERYSVCWSKAPDFNTFQAGIRTSYTTRTIPKQMSAGTYYIRVKSYRDLGNQKKVYGDWSDTAEAIVP